MPFTRREAMLSAGALAAATVFPPETGMAQESASPAQGISAAAWLTSSRWRRRRCPPWVGNTSMPARAMS